MVFVKELLSIHYSHLAFVTPKTLLNLKILNKAFVRLKLISEEPCLNVSPTDLVKKHFDAAESSKNNDFVVQVCIPGDGMLSDVCDGAIYLSPAGHFNVCGKDVAVHRSGKCEVRITPLNDFFEMGIRFRAPECQISLISCSFGVVDSKTIDLSVKDYFSNPRLLQKYEIFCIPVANTFNVFAPNYLWFLVNTIVKCPEPHPLTDAAFVDSVNCTLHESNPVNSLVPSCPCCYRNSPSPKQWFMNEYFINAFEEPTQKLSNIFKLKTTNSIACRDLTVLLEGDKGAGKGLIVRTLCDKNCWHYLEENCFELLTDSLGATEKRIEKLFDLALHCAPCVLHIRNIHLLGKDKEGAHEERRTIETFKKNVSMLEENNVLVVCSTCFSKDITVRLYSEFTYHINVQKPNLHQRENLLHFSFSISDMDINDPIILSDMARKTAGFVLSDILAFAEDLKHNTSLTHDVSKPCTAQETRNLNLSVTSFRPPQKTLIQDESNATELSNDINNIINKTLEDLRKRKAGSSEVVNIPKVTWDDVGGLHQVKQDILDTIELPLKYPDVFTSGLRRSGLLFYGPPGSGKTLLAKAVATEFTLNFYSVKGPELINMYVGQSEENIRNVFKKAREMSPCVIFFDELDSLAPNRGNHGDSGGVMDRIVSQLLAELDGIHNNSDVFIIGATNRPDLLDPALLRPGRFDKMVYVGVAETTDERLRVLKACTRKLNLARNIDLEKLIMQCPPGLTGADFYALAADTQMNCYRRIIKTGETEGVDNPVISMEDFDLALCNITPSISDEELERYKQLKCEINERV